MMPAISNSDVLRMPVHLDSDLLRTFVAVADAGNFTRGGAVVGRTQSAVSMQMQRLEADVGFTLFDRGSRGVTLTGRAEQLLTNARRIVALLDETAALLDPRSLDGSVKIGIPEEYGYPILSQALRAFASRHPNVEVTVRYATSAVQMAALAAGDLDIAVIFEWQDFSDGEVLMIDPTVWVTCDRYAVHRETPLPIAVYENSTWYRDYALRSLRERGEPFRIAYASGTTGGLRLAVSSGLAVAPMARSSIPADCRELTETEGFPAIDASHVVMQRGPRPASAAVDGMAQAMREAFRVLTGRAGEIRVGE